MDKFEYAFKVGQHKAVETSLGKEASAKDITELLKLIGHGAGQGAKGVGAAAKKVTGGASLLGHGGKYLGVVADPRKALIGGLGIAALGGATGEALAKYPHLFGHNMISARAAGLIPAALGAVGGGIMMGANPGMLGGSAANRMTHELSQMSRTPAGMFGTLAGLVGIPAALIAYGKMKGKEESSLF